MNNNVKEYFTEVIESLINKENPEYIRKELYENFIEFETKRWELSNKKAELFLPYKKELYLKDDNLEIEGTIDRIYREKDGTLSLCDIKTGRIPRSYTAIRPYRREMMFYKLLCKMNGIDIKNTFLYFPSKNYILPIKTNRNYDKTILKKIEEVKVRIDSKDFAPKRQFFCTKCRYATFCLFPANSAEKR